jgi:hypothetical protein
MRTATGGVYSAIPAHLLLVVAFVFQIQVFIVVYLTAPFLKTPKARKSRSRATAASPERVGGWKPEE